MRVNRKRAGTRKCFIPPPLSESIYQEFGAAPNLQGLNAIAIGSSIFELEQALRVKRVRKIIVPFYHSAELETDLDEIGALIHELLVFTLAEDIEVEFRNVKGVGISLDLPFEQRRVENVCLFSGGTDSYAGVLLAHEYLGDLEGVFCAHSDQSRII